MKLRKWKALLSKDFKLILNNKNILLLLMLPILFAVIYSSSMDLGDDPKGIYFLLVMITALGMMVVGSSLMALSIAEEKEKKTLRSLVLSDISGFAFIACKMIIITILFTLAMTASFFIVGAPMHYLGKYLLMLLLTTISLLFFGSIVGLLSQTQQSAGVLGTPLMLLFAIPLFSLMGDIEILNKIAKLLPTGPITFLMLQDGGAQISYSNLVGFGSMAAWILIAGVIFLVFYRKKSIDN